MNDPEGTLHARWDGGGLAASPDQAPLLVGRAPGAAVHVGDRAVSRSHLRLAVDDGQWEVLDESSRGTYAADGSRVERVVLGPEETALHLGSPGGPAIRLLVAPAPEEASSLPSVPAIDPGTAWTVATSDPTLRLEAGGRTFVFAPPGRVVVGRDPACDVVCDNELVSRQHVAFTSRDSAWTMEDLGSSRGTFVDGKQLRKPMRAEGAFVAVLGDDDAGEQLQVVTAGTHRKPRRLAPLVTAVAVTAVGAVTSVGIALAVGGGGSDRANTSEQLAAAKSSTAYILASSGGDLSSGSGSFVTDDVVLTNAHVADLGSDPSVFFAVATADSEDEPVLLRALVREVARHPYLDLAVLEVDEPLKEDSLPADFPFAVDPDFDPRAMALGDSRELRVGSRIASLGFPRLSSSIAPGEQGQLVLPVASTSEGEITGLRRWPGCDNEAADDWLIEGTACSTDGDLPRGNLVSDDFSGSGGSGGPVVVDGELVAVRYAARGPVSPEPEGGTTTSGLALSIPIEHFEDWLADVISGG